MSPGTLTVGSLVLGAGARVVYDLGPPNIVGGASNDLTIVNGNLTLGGWHYANRQPGQDGGGDGEFVERPARRIHSPGT